MTTEGLVENLPRDAPLRYACACGHRAEFARVSATDFIHYDEASAQFTVDCPACDTARPTKVLKGTFTGDRLVCIVAGTFRDDPEKPPTGDACFVDSQNAEFEGVPSPVEMASGVFIIRCDECNHLFDEDDRQADADAPEVGWEYYDCPDCGERTRSDIAECTYASP